SECRDSGASGTPSTGVAASSVSYLPISFFCCSTYSSETSPAATSASTQALVILRVTGVLLEADVEKLAADAILMAELSTPRRRRPAPPWRWSRTPHTGAQRSQTNAIMRYVIDH